MIDELTWGVYLGKEEVALDVVFFIYWIHHSRFSYWTKCSHFLSLLEVAFSLVDLFELVVAVLLVDFTLVVVALLVDSLFLDLLDSALGSELLSSLAWAVNDVIWGCLSLLVRVVWESASLDVEAWTLDTSVSSVSSSSS